MTATENGGEISRHQKPRPGQVGRAADRSRPLFTDRSENAEKFTPFPPSPHGPNLPFSHLKRKSAFSRPCNRRRIMRPFGMTYTGGKGNVFQKIVNEIPPHARYVEAFAGGAAVGRAIRPAAVSIFVDLDLDQLQRLAAELAGRPGLQLHHGDGVAFLSHLAGLARIGAPPIWDPATFVYLDPPYPFATRRGGKLYRHEMTDAQHAHLLDVCLRLPWPTILSSYQNDQYDAALAAWRFVDFYSFDRGHNRNRERLYCNFTEPAALHDYRFLGDDKRQRERVAKRRRNWTAALARAGDHERRAILADCQAAVDPPRPVLPIVRT